MSSGMICCFLFEVDFLVIVPSCLEFDMFGNSLLSVFSSSLCTFVFRFALLASLFKNDISDFFERLIVLVQVVDDLFCLVSGVVIKSAGSRSTFELSCFKREFKAALKILKEFLDLHDRDRHPASNPFSWSQYSQNRPDVGH
jgi:hypothetical protein